MRTINASEFKAKCLAILDEVAETRQPLVILKRGTPVAQLFPAVAPASSRDKLAGSVEILGDIVGPTSDAGDWDAARDTQ